MKTILIVENDKTCGMYIEKVLEKIYKTILAQTGKEAIDIFKTNEINLVLLDIRMPEMDGFMILEGIRSVSKNVPVVTQTSYNSSRSKELIMALGSNDYILKPYLPQELLEIVEKNIV